ncbi:SoxR reducing system RseC family protein [Methylonatrum kenyense]|uniref:SoxR reducing system RseC family protein n=1 Tax=Methylonatrum kenyense TaxID=455253 RepID=UPI0020BD93A1|nr:SoxR reducing system RseC family protein [Methylonatrum kenyense]MCK8514747.1 SoxR reducing system RseC family protein [Methylonatrum kenyense]
MSPALVTREAQVIRVDRGAAIVELIDSAGCGGCEAKGSCGVGLLGRVFRRKPTRFTISLSEPLSEGDRVTLGLHPGALMFAAVLGFGLPLAGLLLGSTLATLLVPQMSDFAALLGGLAGLVLGLAVVRWRFHRSRNDPRFQPVLLARS